MQRLKILMFVFIAMVLVACGTGQVPVGNPSALPSATPTLAPTNTAPPSPTPSPTQTPSEATATPTEQATPTSQTTKPPESSNSGQPVTILSTHMLDANTGWGIGQVKADLIDHVLFTQDGGQTWQDRTPQAALQNAPPGRLSATAFFLNPTNAWVIYSNRNFEQALSQHEVWYTQDGGHTWQASQALDLSGVGQEFFIPSDLGFLDAQHGWLLAHLGAGMSHDYIAAFTTADGGQRWQRVLDPEANSGLMGCQKSGLAFSTPMNGWLTGDCPGLMTSLYFYRTTDGGQTWQPVELPVPEGEPSDLIAGQKGACGITHLAYVATQSIRLSLRCTFFDENRSAAWLYTSEDGGQSWAAPPLPMPYGSFNFTSPEDGWLVGSLQSDPSASGEVYATTDGGQSWNALTPTGWQGMPDFVSPLRGWIVAQQGDQLVLVTTSDGGKNWQELKPMIGP